MAAVPASTPGMKSLKGIIAGLLCLSPVISFRKKYYCDFDALHGRDAAGTEF